jgi:hypothetical protein
LRMQASTRYVTLADSLAGQLRSIVSSVRTNWYGCVRESPQAAASLRASQRPLNPQGPFIIRSEYKLPSQRPNELNHARSRIEEQRQQPTADTSSLCIGTNPHRQTMAAAHYISSHSSPVEQPLLPIHQQLQQQPKVSCAGALARLAPRTREYT